MASFRAARQPSPLVWVFFGLKGRISRGIYWLAYFCIVCALAALAGQLMGGETASFHGPATYFGPVAAIVALYANIAIMVKRLHDFGYSGLYALAFVVLVLLGSLAMFSGSPQVSPIASLINLAVTIGIGVVPGTPGPNRFGDVVDRPPP